MLVILFLKLVTLLSKRERYSKRYLAFWYQILDVAGKKKKKKKEV
jgi:hypothetical protein